MTAVIRPRSKAFATAAVVSMALGTGSPRAAHAEGVDAVQSIAVGHFNRPAAIPGMDDIAIGLPLDLSEGGSVTVHWWDPASSSRKNVKITQLLLRNSFTIKSDLGTIDGAVARDHFGAALAVGDFNADGLSDLAIGSPDEDVLYGNSISGSGCVHVLYGTSGSGWAGTPFQQQTRLLANPFLRYPPGNFDGVHDTDEQFGYALNVNNFDNNPADDLAVGVPGAHGMGSLPTGRVYLYSGSQGTAALPIGGLMTTVRSYIDNPNSSPSDREFFGGSLASGRFRHVFDPKETQPVQLAIGAMNGRVRAGNKAGAGFIMLYSFSARSQFIEMALNSETYYDQTSVSPAGAETSEYRDHFGFSMAAVPTGTATDLSLLLISAPWEDAGSANTGVVHLFSPAGLVQPQVIYSNTLGAVRQKDAFFGKSVAGGFLRKVGASPFLFGAIIGEPGRDSTGGVAYHLGETQVSRGQLSLIETWAQTMPIAGTLFGEAVAVGVFGPPEVQMGTPTVGKGYVGLPGDRKIMQFNVDVTGSIRKPFLTP